MSYGKNKRIQRKINKQKNYNKLFTNKKTKLKIVNRTKISNKKAGEKIGRR